MVQTSTSDLVSSFICQHLHHAAHNESTFQVRIWRRVPDHFPEIPSPLDHDCHVTETVVRERRHSKVLVSILAEDGNDDEITDESHSVDDYDKDENEEYNDY